jgi:hypothetical protein
MPHRCVVYGCSNTTNLREGIALHCIPYANDTRPEAKKRRKAWVDFVRRKRDKWEPSVHSEVCSKHFKEEDFASRFIGLNEMPGAEKPLLVAPRLKQDDMGICVCPSKHDDEETSTLSSRDRRRIVSVINVLLFTSYDLFYFAFFRKYNRNMRYDEYMNI